jgi:hypothetical protein
VAFDFGPGFVLDLLLNLPDVALSFEQGFALEFVSEFAPGFSWCGSWFRRSFGPWVCP